MRKPTLGKHAFIAAGTVLALATGTGISYAAGAFGNGDKLVGKQPDGSYLTQTGQVVTPAGDVIQVKGRPFGLALSPDGKNAAALNTGGGTSGIITVFDLVGHKVLQQIGSGGISNGGVLYALDGRHLWAAQTANLVRFDVARTGRCPVRSRSACLA